MDWDLTFKLTCRCRREGFKTIQLSIGESMSGTISSKGTKIEEGCRRRKTDIQKLMEPQKARVEWG